MNLQEIPIDSLEPHPLNSNVMPAKLREKLVEHMRSTGRYPPVIVRPLTVDGQAKHQILDGHHRVAALRKLGEAAVRCVVWDVGDEEALTLLATLNRLQGQDDPKRRAALLQELASLPGVDLKALHEKLPEDRAGLQALLKLNSQPPRPKAPTPLQDVPVPVHFFLLPEHKRALEELLATQGGTREQALLALLGLPKTPDAEAA